MNGGAFASSRPPVRGSPTLSSPPYLRESARSSGAPNRRSVAFDGGRSTSPTRPELTIEVRCGEAPMTIRSAEGRVSVHPGHATAPDLVLTGPPDVTVGLLARHIGAAEAKARGVAVTGDVRLLRRLRPNMPSAPAAPAR
jgi:hypothetical protein